MGNSSNNLKVAQLFHIWSGMSLLFVIRAIILFSGSSAFAQELAYSNVSDRYLRIQVGPIIPPYVMGPNVKPSKLVNDKPRGAELDIVQEAMALEGYHIEFRYAEFLSKNNNRNYDRASNPPFDRADAIMGVANGNELGGCYSRPYIFYRNVAISLSSRRYVIDSIEDLRGQRITGPKVAPEELGVNFLNLFSDMESFEEATQYREQTIRLFQGHTDFVVGDLNVFNWLVERGGLPENVDVSQSIAVHPIFSQKPKYLVFQDQATCDAFNKGMKRLEKNGRYQEILSSYNLH